jgi:CRP/FNR family transcriptional regulator, cyclic AMP receptor protein
VDIGKLHDLEALRVKPLAEVSGDGAVEAAGSPPPTALGPCGRRRALPDDGVGGPELRPESTPNDWRASRQTNWLDRQSAEFRQAVLMHAHRRRLAGGATLHVAGDPPGGIYGVLEGALLLSIPDARSEMHLADLLLPGDWAGGCSLLDQEPRRFSAEAQGETLLCVLPSMAMRRIAARFPDGATLFLDLAADALRVAELGLVDLVVPCPRRRLAATLARCCRGRPVPLPLTQAQLAVLANVSRKLVNRTLQQFRRAGWIELGYSSLTVLEPRALAAYAEPPEPRGWEPGLRIVPVGTMLALEPARDVRGLERIATPPS